MVSPGDGLLTSIMIVVGLGATAVVVVVVVVAGVVGLVVVDGVIGSVGVVVVLVLVLVLVLPVMQVSVAVVPTLPAFVGSSPMATGTSMTLWTPLTLEYAEANRS